MTHIPMNQTECPICKKSIKPRSKLWIHMVVHTGERPYPCNICDMKFTQVGSRKLHIEKVHKNLIKAYNANEQITPITLQKKPTWTSQLLDKECWLCPVCKQDLESHTRLHEHFVVHTSERPYVCKYCRKEFTSNTSARLHIKAHHPYESPDHGTLTKKGSIFLLKNPWEAMGLTLTTSGQKKQNSTPTTKDDNMSTKQRITHKCIECRMECNSEEKLKLHVEQQHRTRPLHLMTTDDRIRSGTPTNQISFACPKCEVTFKWRDSLTMHMKTAHGQHKEPLSQGENVHEKVVQERLKPIRIKIEPGYEHKKRKRHVVAEVPAKVKRDRTGKSFPCKYCDKAYKYLKGLQAHVKTVHKNVIEEVPTTCRECGKKYANAIILQRHMLQKHKIGDRSIKCKTCDQLFKSKLTLKRHQKIHAVAAPYSCKLCNHRFNQGYNLKRHMQISHNV